jgi:Skp family chaperone for outer membrane proteins
VRHWLIALLLGVLSGCVPVARFEETQSVAQVEMEARRRSEQQAQQLEAENAQLKAQIQQKSEAVQEREERLSQAELDSTTQGKQRQDAEGMVEQLRGELQRASGHLQVFHDEKQKLQAELGTEVERSKENARVTRDLSLALAEPISVGTYTLDAAPQGVVLRVPRSDVLSTDGAVKTEAAALLDAVAKVLSLHKTTKLRVEDSSAPGDALAAARVVQALTERAVGGERFDPLLPDAAAAQPTDEPEILFGFSAS